MLDVLLDREPHTAAGAQVFALIDSGRLRGLVGATTLTTVHSIAAKGFGSRKARELVRGLLELFDVANVDREVLASAIDLDFADFEDAVLHEAGRAAGAAAIVTRDRGGFAHALLPILAPGELLALVAAARDDSS